MEKDFNQKWLGGACLGNYGMGTKFAWNEFKDLKGKKIISAIKGIVPDENMIIGEFMNQYFDIPFNDIIVISGPCHAEEVALEKLSYLTIASQNSELASHFSSMLNTRYIKTNVSDDIFGTEYAAVLKNIYAVASGICRGIGYGDNFQAVLMSNGIREMKKFIRKVHKMKRNINNSDAFKRRNIIP